MIKGNFFQLVMLVCSLVLVSAGCTEEDDYKKFLEGGEIYYPGRIEGTKVFSGKEQVRLYGLFISDPKVTQCLVYWNIRQDSVIFPVVRENIIDTLDEVIPVEEGIHNFEFITMDDKGNRSVVVNVTGHSFGEKFQSQLNNRPILDTTYVEESDSLSIFWAGMDLSTGAYETEVQYNLGSNIISERTPIGDTATYINDYDGTGFKYRTFFRPDTSSIDVFWTDFEVVDE